jgi:integrase
MQAKISKRVVDAATAAKGDELWIWDTELKGFGLRVRPNGRRTYVLEYRPGRGGRSTQKRRISIGIHGSPWTPDMARKEALRLLGVVASGGDPAADKTAGKEAPRVDELVERFLREHVEAKRKASTAKEYRRLLDKFVVPAIGHKRVVDVSRPDILKIHNGMTATPYQANRLLAVVCSLFNFGALAGDRPPGTNPTAGIESYPEKERERMLSAQELGWLGEALADEERHAAEVSTYEARVREARQRFAAARAVDDRRAGGVARRELAELRAARPVAAVPPQAILCFRLLFFTGARCSEIQTLQRLWIDFERAEARLPDSKTGVKTVHLPPPALELLASAPRIAGNPYVITGEREGAHFVGLFKCWQQIRNAATVKAWASDVGSPAARIVGNLTQSLGRSPTYMECLKAAEVRSVDLPVGLSNLRLHDLRHAFASVAASSGMGLPIIGKMLGHAQPSTTQRYAHLAPDPVKAAAASVAAKIDDGLRASGRVGTIYRAV